jgi:multidrug resistance efflux pump
VPEANPDANQERQRRQRELLAELKTANAALADSSWALAELEQQIEQLAAAENSAAPPVARRIADLRRWRVALEERTLRHMLRADAISAELAALP